ncbi:ClbS/DfsB family four-helix bundle protein [Streptococcaceae bacterium ESL0729]|nr:ClbS/DfsB family four-helix bundle protein [Streptococcaceae bacterium ESL0729]
MKVYKDKEELKSEIKKSYDKYIAEFKDIPENLKDQKSDASERTPAENLAYQLGWTNLLLSWERDEKLGLEVKTPSDKFKWNQLGDLYKWFTDTYASLSLDELEEKLSKNVDDILKMIDGMTEEEIFEVHQRKWADGATKNAVWEVYKFIHINTVAPFGTFRTKIRKWKREFL